ncbi:MAG TPA: hypothetical protein VGM29_04015 [Polyangiaceae bacterium]
MVLQLGWLASLSCIGCSERSEVVATVLSAPGTADAASVAPTPPRFAPPVLVSPLSDDRSIDEDPTFTGDLLELFFMSTRAGNKDIWTSLRASAADAWGAPSLVAELSSTANDWSPCVSLDGLRIWLASERAGGPGQIYLSTRASRSGAWGTPSLVSALSGDNVDFAPALDATETVLFFSSNRTGSAGYDLYESTRANSGATWGAPTLIAGLNSADDEYDPFVAQGGLVVFFTSMRSGAGDIYWSSRGSTSEAFLPPVLLTDVDSAEYDSDSTLSQDLSYMMFSSTRTQNAEIYETHLLQ